MFEDRVKRDHHRYLQRADEIDDIGTVLAAEYAVLMLDADEAKVAEVDVLRRADVVRFDVLPDFEFDFGRVVVLSRGLRHRQHYRRRTVIVAINGMREVGGERGDSTAAWAVRADESDRDRAAARFGARIRRHVDCASMQRPSRAVVRRCVRYRWHLASPYAPSTQLPTTLFLRRRTAADT